MWKDYFPELVYAYNSSTKKSISYSLFFVMFRRSSKLLTDFMFNVNIGLPSRKLYGQLVSGWKNQMNTAIKIGQENTTH